MDDATEARLRGEAMAWLTVRTQDGARSISREELGDFTFDGEPFRLIPTQTGIWKPASMSAALTIVSKEGSPYPDGTGPDGLLRYNWRGVNGQQADNRALRAAMERKVPLIWLFGIGQAQYQPVYPVYLLREEPEEHRFVVVPETFREVAPFASPIENELRRYIIRQTRERLHQPLFRATVLRAYGGALRRLQSGPRATPRRRAYRCRQRAGRAAGGEQWASAVQDPPRSFRRQPFWAFGPTL